MHTYSSKILENWVHQGNLKIKALKIMQYRISILNTFEQFSIVITTHKTMGKVIFSYFRI